MEKNSYTNISAGWKNFKSHLIIEFNSSDQFSTFPIDNIVVKMATWKSSEASVPGWALKKLANEGQKFARRPYLEQKKEVIERWFIIENLLNERTEQN